MSVRQRVWVELNSENNPIRIFRNRKASFDKVLVFENSRDLMDRTEAVYSIRLQIYLRSKGDCELCAAPLTELSGHMHEQKHRGKGGEISLENSVFICAKCHNAAHSDREPKFTRRAS